jgi:hypothetical protein
MDRGVTEARIANVMGVMGAIDIDLHADKDIAR